MRYRLRYHSPLAYRTIILEANYTHTGKPKPLHIRAAFSDSELEEARVTLISVPFTEDEVRRAQCKARACLLVLEDSQRRFVNTLVTAELAALRKAGRHDVLVFMSDIDELLDVGAVQGGYTVPRCVSPLMRMFAYGERCPALSPPWAKSVLFNASAGWFESATTATPQLQLRKLARQCPPTQNYLGWHFTYFLSTDQVCLRTSTARTLLLMAAEHLGPQQLLSTDHLEAADLLARDRGVRAADHARHRTERQHRGAHTPLHQRARQAVSLGHRARSMRR